MYVLVQSVWQLSFEFQSQWWESRVRCNLQVDTWLLQITITDKRSKRNENKKALCVFKTALRRFENTLKNVLRTFESKHSLVWGEKKSHSRDINLKAPVFYRRLRSIRFRL